MPERRAATRPNHGPAMKRSLSLAIAPLFLAATVRADDEDLAKKLQNPVADLISLPIQNNFLFNVGPYDGFREQTNIQPVIPFELSEHWNLISRTILPVIYQEGIAPGLGSQFGLGDITQSFFFSPKDPDPFIWGVGPVLLIPTATDDLLGTEKWGAGPTFVIVKQDGPWTYGMLANHIWSFAGDGDRQNVSNTFLQPFLSYTTKSATTFTVNTETTYDWLREDWTVPINGGVSQLFKIGKQPVSVALLGTWYAEAPDSAPDWGVRLVLTFLFPEKS